MILDKIDEYLNRQKKSLIKEDIDSLDVTDDVIRLIESLSDQQLDAEQLELKDKILALLDRSIENLEAGGIDDFSDEVPEDTFEDFETGMQDPDTIEPIMYDPDKFYDDQTIWDKGLSEGGKKKSASSKKKPAKNQEKNINKSNKKK